MARLTLAQAQAEGRLDEFIAEHKGETGDQLELERVIRSMAGTSKEVPEASSPDDCDD
tara:strand:+ start:609 stop:782 length:174 start_codon:yes stop_codon:yes gene_type:complete